MPLPVANFTVQFPTSTSMVKVALVALREISNILFRWFWNGSSSGSMDNNCLLFLCGILRWLLLFIVLELPLVVPPFSLVSVGDHGTLDGPMIDKLLCQFLGTLKGSRFRGQNTIMNLG